MNYRLSVDSDVLEFFSSLRKADQIRLLHYIERLRNSPFSKGQTVVMDDVGRAIQVGVVDRFRISYWTDHAVETVQVVKIELNN